MTGLKQQCRLFCEAAVGGALQAARESFRNRQSSVLCVVHRGLLATGVLNWWKCYDVGEMQLARLKWLFWHEGDVSKLLFVGWGVGQCKAGSFHCRWLWPNLWLMLMRRSFLSQSGNQCLWYVHGTMVRWLFCTLCCNAQHGSKTVKVLSNGLWWPRNNLPKKAKL